MTAAVQELWDAYNSTGHDLPGDAGDLVARVDASAARWPERPAVRTARETLTHRELARRSDEVAGRLAAAGVTPGGIVAVAVSRQAPPLAGILGVLKAGCGYVPIDAGDPEPRIRFILQDSASVALLGTADQVPLLRSLAGDRPVQVLPGGPGDGAGAPAPPRPAVPPAGPDAIRYVIYTSGTTGVPKGVRITEGNLRNFVDWCLSDHDVSAQDRFAVTAPLTFDPAVQQIFPAWVAGACVVPVPDAEVLDPDLLLRWLRRERITVVDAVTAQWHHWRAAAEQDAALRPLPDLRWVLVGGETLYHHETRQWHRVVHSPALLRNVYGPTEATVNATSVVVDPDTAEGQVSIGVPLPNYRLYVVDGEDRLCGLGGTGELLIAGAGVAAGYQSAEATAKAFTELTLPDGRVERVYRTGDLARLVGSPDGGLALDFAGRMDTQVKIRGFRIELEEIEEAAKTVPGVADAAVQLRAPGSEQLVCFYVAGGSMEADRLRALLAARLAGHQVPNLLLRLDAFPVTRNGKLDRAALSAALESRLAAREPEGPAPGTAAERLVAEVWARVLGLARVGAGENFFAIGGTSLLAVRAVRELRARGLRVSPTDLFARPTVAALAAPLPAPGPERAPARERAPDAPVTSPSRSGTKNDES